MNVTLKHKFWIGCLGCLLLGLHLPGMAQLANSLHGNDAFHDTIAAGITDSVAIEEFSNESANDTARKLVYTFPIREDIMPAMQRLTEKNLKQAREMDADVILIQMNTYGGLANVADSIRTAILNSPIPVWVYIDNQAISAGALIAIAADSIYMRPGGSIGAASVVNGNGQPMPDKFQSFMRSMMRATAESHGKRVESVRNGDTTWRWHRDPEIAERMVGVSSGDTTTLSVLTLTTDEALKVGYAEGKASSLREVLELAGVADYEVYEYKPTGMDRFLGWLTHPAVQGIFVMMIIGGIYFELQTPGVGLPLIVAIAGAVLYFAPLYVEGVARNWELLLFVVGLILIGIEIFVLPGFGIAGISGIVAVVLGLTFAAIDNELFRYLPTGEVRLTTFLQPLLVVVVSVSLAILGLFWLTPRVLGKPSLFRDRVVLTTDLSPDEGYVGREWNAELIGEEGVVAAVLRPSGKVVVDGRYYDAAAEDGQFIDKGTVVRIVRVEGGVLYCRKLWETHG